MKRRTSLTNVAIAGKIRFLCFVAIAVSLGSSAAFALDPMGPPRAGLYEGQFSIGADAGLGETEFELTSGKLVVKTASPPTSGSAPDNAIKSFETSKLYCTVGHGFAKNWEAFVGIGATKAEFGDDLWGLGENFDSGIGLGVRGGIKATLFEIPEVNLVIGGLFQANWANYDGKLDVPISVQPAPDFVEIDLIEMQIAAGATYLWADGFAVYAGPFVYYIKGDMEEYDVGGGNLTWDIDEGPVWGAYIGAQVDLAKNCVLNIEYQHASDANLLGAGLKLTY